MLHVGFGAQHVAAIGKVAGAHAAEQRQIFFHASVAMRAFHTRLAVPAALRRDGLGVLVVDVGEACIDEVFGPLVELFEVVAGVDRLAGFEAQPTHVVDDCVDVLGLLGHGVGVVEAQLADAAELFGDTEVDADGLGVADVQVPVRLGWEACPYPPAEGALLDVGAHQVAHKVGGGGSVRCVAHRT